MTFNMRLESFINTRASWRMPLVMVHYKGFEDTQVYKVPLSVTKNNFIAPCVQQLLHPCFGEGYQEWKQNKHRSCKKRVLQSFEQNKAETDQWISMSSSFFGSLWRGNANLKSVCDISFFISMLRAWCIGYLARLSWLNIDFCLWFSPQVRLDLHWYFYPVPFLW